MKVVLGPCPCKSCGRLLVYDGFGWRNYRTPTARYHRCPAKEKAA